jgi:hypothetical protein
VWLWDVEKGVIFYPADMRVTMRDEETLVTGSTSVRGSPKSGGKALGFPQAFSHTTDGP